MTLPGNTNNCFLFNVQYQRIHVSSSLLLQKSSILRADLLLLLPHLNTDLLDKNKYIYINTCYNLDFDTFLL